MLKYDDFVAITYRAQAVRDDDACTSATPQIVVNDLLGDWIERSGSFIEYDYRRIGHKRAGNLDALALTTTKIGTAFVYMAVVVAGARCDVFMDGGIL